MGAILFFLSIRYMYSNPDQSASKVSQRSFK